MSQPLRTIRGCVLTPIRKLDDCFGDFLVRVVCECGSCREIQPQALARLVGSKMTLKELALRSLLSVDLLDQLEFRSG
jgi:hypothetical protein